MLERDTQIFTKKTAKQRYYMIMEEKKVFGGPYYAKYDSPKEICHNHSKIGAAAQYGSLNVIKELITKHKVRIDDEHEIALYNAIIACDTTSNLETVEFLIDNGASLSSYEDTILIDAIEMSLPLHLIQKIIDRMANERKNNSDNMGLYIDFEGREGITAFYVALCEKRFDICETLLKAGANLHHKDYLGRNYLFEAYDDDVQQYLINKGLDVNSRDLNGKTPIMGCGFERTKTLLDNGADVTVIDNHGNTIIHCNPDLVIRLDLFSKLKDAGIHINQQNIMGQTPLHCRNMGFRNNYIVDDYVKHGADLSIVDNNGDTVLAHWVTRYDWRILNTLIDYYPAALNMQNNKGNTPLMIILKHFSYCAEMVNILLQYKDKIDFSLKDKVGNTLFDLIGQAKDEKVINVLKNHGLLG
jgi:ankyrin repeat protein